MRILFGLSATSLALSASVFAQAISAKPGPTTTVEPSATPVADFSDQVVKIEDVGLSVALPAGCAVEKLTVKLQSATQIVAEDQSWSVLIRVSRVSNPNLDVHSVNDEVAKSLLASVGIVSHTLESAPLRPQTANSRPETTFQYAKGGIVERVPEDRTKPLFLQNGATKFPLDRVYVALAQGNDKPQAVKGVTVVQTAQQQFVVFELTTTDKEFDRVKPIYETMVASSRFADTNELNAARGIAVEAGIKLLRDLTEDDYREVLSKPERWIRMYRPAPTNAVTDADEVGYTRIRSFVGQRGLLDETRPKAQWNLADREEGYVVQIDSRVMVAGQMYDSKATYFMSPNRESEAWTARSAGRAIPAPSAPTKKETPAVATEIGARVGRNMTVTATATGRGEEVTQPEIKSDGYVSRVDAMLLPQFMLRSKSASEYAFYTWQNGTSKIQLRRDTLTPPPEPGGIWKLVTRIGDAERVQTSLYTDAGELVRTEMPDGIIYEPTTKERLVDLWRSKGLPMN